jgi:hypothetical protein
MAGLGILAFYDGAIGKDGISALVMDHALLVRFGAFLLSRSRTHHFNTELSQILR